MSANGEQPLSDENEHPPDDEHEQLPDDDVVRRVARVSEPVLSATSAGFSIAAVAVAVAGEIPLAGPLVAVAVTGLLPIVSAAVERRREARSQRAMRARAYADSAWDTIMASREG
jgi:hypothetical protein